LRLNILGNGWLTDRLCVCDLETPGGGGRGGGGKALSPSLPTSVGVSRTSDGGRGKGLSLESTREVVLRVGVLPELPLCKKRDDQDGGIASARAQDRSLHIPTSFSSLQLMTIEAECRCGTSMNAARSGKQEHALSYPRP